MPTSFLVRFVIVSIFAVFAVGFLLPPSQAQPPGFPPRPPGGISGAPGGFSGPPPGFPGAPGGISGMPPRPPGAGISGIGGPGVSGMPGRPPGAGVSGISGAGISGVSGAGIGGISGMGGPSFGGPSVTTYSWSCGKCGASLGTTTTPHGSGHTRCPVCNVFFTGTSVTPGGGAPGGSGIAPAVGGGFPMVPAPLPPNPGVSSPPPSPPSGFFPAAPAPSSESESEGDGANANEGEADAPSGRSRTLKLIGIVCGSILLIGAIGTLVVVLANANSKPARRPQRRVIDDWRGRD